MKFQPALSKVLVRREAAEEKSAGGLFLPTVAQEKPLTAVVVAVGPGAQYWDNKENTMRTIPVAYKPGDRVLVPKFGANEIKLDGEELALINENEILGKFTD